MHGFEEKSGSTDQLFESKNKTYSHYLNMREQEIYINRFVSTSNVTAIACIYQEEIHNDEIYFVSLFKDSTSQQSYVIKLLNRKQVLHTSNRIPQTRNSFNSLFNGHKSNLTSVITEIKIKLAHIFIPSESDTYSLLNRITKNCNLLNFPLPNVDANTYGFENFNSNPVVFNIKKDVDILGKSY